MSRSITACYAQHAAKLSCHSTNGCRGYKVVVKFFPNEAANLEPVVAMLLKIEDQVILPFAFA